MTCVYGKHDCPTVSAVFRFHASYGRALRSVDSNHSLFFVRVCCSICFVYAPWCVATAPSPPNHQVAPVSSASLKHALATVTADEVKDKEKRNREDFRRTDHFVRACRAEEQQALVDAFAAQRARESEARRAAYEKVRIFCDT